MPEQKPDAGVSCFGGSRRCDGAVVQFCTGLGWTNVQACQRGEECVDARCTSACESGCPNGTYCEGVTCLADADGGVVDVVIDVPTVRFDVVLTLDGGLPLPTASCETTGVVANANFRRFKADGGYAGEFHVAIGCDGGSAMAQGIPGEYLVTVTARASTMPPVQWRAQRIPEDGGTLRLSAQLTAVSGRVRVNGATPALGQHCSASPGAYTAEVRFISEGGGWIKSALIYCSTQDFSFEATGLPVGRYDVEVLLMDNAFEVAATSPLPSTRDSAWKVLEDVAVPSSTPLELNVDRAYVSGRLLLDGVQPVSQGTCPAGTFDRVSIRWIGDGGLAYDTPVECGAGDFRFSGALPPGVHTAYVTQLTTQPDFGGLRLADLPSGTWRSAAINFANGATQTVDLNVESRLLADDLRVEGAAPTIFSGCAEGSRLGDVVVRQKLPWSQRVLLPIKCDGSFGPREVTRSDDYELSTMGTNDTSNLPRVERTLLSTAVLTSQLLVVETVPDVMHPISGSITMNGAPLRGGCLGGRAWLAFTNQSGARLLHELTCSTGDWSWSVQLPAGEWFAELSMPLGTDGHQTPVAGWPRAERFSFDGALTVGATSTPFVLDVPVRWVRSHLTVNGAAPVHNGNCFFGQPDQRLHFGRADGRYGGTLQSNCASAQRMEGPLFEGTFDVFAFLAAPSNTPDLNNVPRNQLLANDVVIR